MSDNKTALGYAKINLEYQKMLAENFKKTQDAFTKHCFVQEPSKPNKNKTSYFDSERVVIDHVEPNCVREKQVKTECGKPVTLESTQKLNGDQFLTQHKLMREQKKQVISKHGDSHVFWKWDGKQYKMMYNHPPKVTIDFETTVIKAKKNKLKDEYKVNIPVDNEFTYDPNKVRKKRKIKDFILPTCIQRIHTFYALELLYHQMKAGAYNQWFTQNQIDEVEIELEIFANKLKLHLLDVVEYSICCESRHIVSESSFRADRKLFSRVERKAARELNNTYGRSEAVRTIHKIIPQPSDRIDFCRRAFDLTWEAAYGGQKWAEGCRAWLKLYDARKLEDVIFWIDRVYDLQHNNGVLFNKHLEYVTLDHYVHQALDRKRNAKNIYDVIFKQIYANQHSAGLLPLVLPKYYKIFTKYLRRFPHQKHKKLYELEVNVPANLCSLVGTGLRRGHVERSQHPKILRHEEYVTK